MHGRGKLGLVIPHIPRYLCEQEETANRRLRGQVEARVLTPTRFASKRPDIQLAVEYIAPSFP